MKKNIKKWLALSLSSISIFTMTACGGAGDVNSSGNVISEGKGYELITADTQYVVSQQRTPEKYATQIFPQIGGEGVMPVGVFYGPFDRFAINRGLKDYTNCEPTLDFHTDYYYKLMKDCGINYIGGDVDTYNNGPAGLMKSLDMCSKYGLGYQVAINRNGYFYVKDFINHPACLGANMGDEPTGKLFAELADFSAKFRADNWGDDKVVGNNLLPIYGANFWGDKSVIEHKNMTYEEYTIMYLDMVQPDYLLYDYYVYASEESSYKKSVQYFQNMSFAREQAIQRDIPLWLFGQASSVGSSGNYVPNESQVLWNVNTCLAYGAKGIQYWMYIGAFYKTDLEGVYDYSGSGMIGMAGNINHWYYSAQKANKQIAAVDHVLMHSANIGVIPHGEISKKLTKGGSEVLSSFRELQSIEGEEVLVGCFDYQGKTALYVVNNTDDTKQNVKLNFDNKYGYTVVQRAVEVEVACKSLPLTLEAGEGVLVVLK